MKTKSTLPIVDKTKPLSILQQLKIVSDARERVLFNLETNIHGLCYILLHEIDKYTSSTLCRLDIQSLIPLFTYEEALKVDKAGLVYKNSSGYWWDCNVKGNMQRVIFLEHIMASLKISIVFPLPIKEQIFILENIDWGRMIKLDDGLCGGIKHSAYSAGVPMLIKLKSSDLIPLFTRKNALKFGGFSSYYWWPRTKFGYFLRVQFINWIIRKLKHEDRRS